MGVARRRSHRRANSIWSLCCCAADMLLLYRLETKKKADSGRRRHHRRSSPCRVGGSPLVNIDVLCLEDILTRRQRAEPRRSLANQALVGVEVFAAPPMEGISPTRPCPTRRAACTEGGYGSICCHGCPWPCNGSSRRRPSVTVVKREYSRLLLLK